MKSGAADAVERVQATIEQTSQNVEQWAETAVREGAHKAIKGAKTAAKEQGKRMKALMKKNMEKITAAVRKSAAQMKGAVIEKSKEMKGKAESMMEKTKEQTVDK